MTAAYVHDHEPECCNPRATRREIKKAPEAPTPPGLSAAPTREMERMARTYGNPQTLVCFTHLFFAPLCEPPYADVVAASSETTEGFAAAM